MSGAPVHPDNAAQAEFWNGPGGTRWAEHQDHHDRALRPATDCLLAAAGARPGERVIDVGCGCGAMTAEFAARVAPDGEALGLDISALLVGHAQARAAGHGRVRFVVGDAMVHDVPPASADLVVSRFGVMFFADPARAFANLRKGLRPGGRLAFVCWRAARLNPWAVLPLREALKHAPPLPEIGPEEPGPFSFADDARVRHVLSAAGYADIDVTPRDLEIDNALGKGLDAAVTAAMSIGPTSRMLADQNEQVRAAVAADLRAVLAPYERGGEVPLNAAVWIVTATNPQPQARAIAETPAL